MTPTLGTLEQVDVRAIWPNEATSFTPWLAGDGFALLADTLGIEMELLGTEQQVSEFKADIVARRTDTPDEHIVLIENQLERTDHGHLGQLLTYAAGKQAATIVWVAREFTEAHRAALDWLNSITAEHFEFYGLEIEAWRIGASPAAPKFNMVVRPNDWSRTARVVSPGTFSDLKMLQQEYWEALRQRLIARKSPVKPQKALPQHWTNFALGRSGIWMSAAQNSREKWIWATVDMNGPPDKLWFHHLLAQRDAIEAEFGGPLEWDELPGRKSSRIAVYRRNTDSTNQADWPAQHEWLIDQLERLQRVIGKRVRDLPDGALVVPDDAPNGELA
jgi:hypothetical protein